MRVPHSSGAWRRASAPDHVCLSTKIKKIASHPTTDRYSVAAEPVAPRLHVAILLHDLRGGGAEKVMLKIGQGLIERGCDVDLVLVNASGVHMEAIPQGARVINLNRRRVSQTIPRLMDYFQRGRPTCVISSLTHVNIAAILSRVFGRNLPRLVVVEHNQISRKAERARTLSGRLTYLLVPLLYRLSDHVVAVSKGAANDVTSFARLAPARVRCIYNPVYDFELSRLAREPVDHPWLNDTGDPVILGVGRLHTAKGFDVLMRAFARVRDTRPCKLVILGEGPERASLLQLAAALGVQDHVSMPGFVSNPYAFMSRSAAFVLSSRFEGLSLVLIEALACGAPCVATDCPSGPREIMEDGRHGALVPVGDPVAMGDAIALALDKPHGVHVARGEAFTVDAAIESYMVLISGALSEAANDASLRGPDGLASVPQQNGQSGHIE